MPEPRASARLASTYSDVIWRNPHQNLSWGLQTKQQSYVAFTFSISIYQVGHFFPIRPTAFLVVIDLQEAAKVLEVFCLYTLHFQGIVRGWIPILHIHRLLMQQILMCW